jgi:hypothetical protein
MGMGWRPAFVLNAAQWRRAKRREGGPAGASRWREKEATKGGPSMAVGSMGRPIAAPGHRVRAATMGDAGEHG